MISFRVLLLTVVPMTLFGCSNGKGPIDGATIVPTYETLNSTAARTSEYGSVGARVDTSDPSNIVVVEGNGTITHNTGAVSLDDGLYVFADPDGQDTSGTYSDGAGGTLAENSSLSISGYEYLQLVEQGYTTGGKTYAVNGVAGILTNTADILATGSATYKGDAAGTFVTATDNLLLTSGNSTVSTDFAANSVDVTMTGFTVTDQNTLAAGSAPFDTINVTGMSLSGNRFIGGAVTTELGGSNVAISGVTGAGTSSASAGAFFGYDDVNAVPDEVGGTVVSAGSGGVLISGFVAD